MPVAAQFDRGHFAGAEGQEEEDEDSADLRDALIEYKNALRFNPDNAEQVEREHFAYAMEHEDDGDIQSAIIEYKNVLRVNPANNDARVRLGRLQMRIGDNVDAQKNLVQALERGARRDLIVFDLGSIYLRNGEYEKVLATVLPGDGATPREQARAMGMIGMAQFWLGEDRMAREWFQAALELDPRQPRALAGLGQLALRSGDAGQIESALEWARARDPDDAFLWVMIGGLEMQLGRFESAVEAFQRALGIEAGYLNALLGMAAARIAQDRLQDARPWAEQVIAEAPGNPDANRALARIAIGENRLEHAAKHLEQVLWVLPSDIEGILALASVYYDLERFQRSLTLTQRFLNRFPHYLPARKLLAMTQLAIGASDQALWGLESLSEKHPDDLQLFALMIKAAIQAGKPAQARLYAKQAMEAPVSESLRALIEGVDRRVHHGEKLELAVPMLDQLIATYQSVRRRERFQGVMAAFKRQDFDAVEAKLPGLLMASPESPVVHLLTGMARFSAGDQIATRVSIDKALQLDPQNVRALNALAALDLLEGRVDAAKVVLDRTLEVAPENFSAQMAMAQVAVAKGEREELVAWLEMARRSHRNASAPRYVLAWLYFEQGQRSEASTVVAELETLVPGEPRLLELQGALQLAGGDFKTAAATLAAAVKARPQVARTRHRLGRAQVLTGMRKEALASYRKALELDPAAVEVAAELILLEREAGRVDSALAVAKALRERNPLAGHMLEGDIYSSQSDAGSALMSYLAALNQTAVVSKQRRDAVVERLVPRFAQLAITPMQQQQVVDALRRAEPNHVAASDLEGRLISSRDGAEAALGFYRGLVETEPSERLWVLRLAAAQRAAGQAEASLAALRQWLARNPSDAEANLLLGSFLLADGLMEQALVAYNQVLAVWPDSVTALNNAAWLSVDSKPGLALEYARKAARLSEGADVLHTLGVVLMKNGRVGAAADALRQALDKAPRNFEMQYDYARALSMLGKAAEARKVLVQLLAEPVAFANRDKAEALLAEIDRK